MNGNWLFDLSHACHHWHVIRVITLARSGTAWLRILDWDFEGKGGTGLEELDALWGKDAGRASVLPLQGGFAVHSCSCLKLYT
jgi:hypothetical protein